MKINIAQVVNSAKGELLLMDTTLADAFLEKKINEAAMHINSLKQFSVNCRVLDIDCYEAELPFEAERIIAIQLVPADGSSCCALCENNPEPLEDRVNISACLTSCGAIWTADRNVLTGLNGLGVPSCFNSNTYFAQNGYLKLPSTVTATQVKVWYYGYNTDEDGIMILDELQERALYSYACWRYALAHFKSYSSEQRREWKKDWVSQKNWLGGKAFKDDSRLNKAKFAAIASAMVVSPYQVLNNNL